MRFSLFIKYMRCVPSAPSIASCVSAVQLQRVGGCSRTMSGYSSAVSILHMLHSGTPVCATAADQRHGCIWILGISNCHLGKPFWSDCFWEVADNVRTTSPRRCPRGVREGSEAGPGRAREMFYGRAPAPRPLPPFQLEMRVSGGSSPPRKEAHQQMFS